MIKEQLNDYARELAQCNSEREKLQVIISFGELLEEFSNEKFSVDDKVPGCASDVFIKVYLEGGIVFIKGRAASLIVKGYVAIIIDVLQGHSKEEVLQSKKYVELFVKESGLSSASLVPTRTNAFARMYEFLLEKVKEL